MSEANKVQIGGEHYKRGGEEHWDRMWRLHGRGYFVGCITGYVERYPWKNGVEDLKKAKHFIEKLIELESQPKTKPQPVIPEAQFVRTIVSKDGESLPAGWSMDGSVYSNGDKLYVTNNGERIRAGNVTDALAKLGQVGEATRAYVNQGDHP